MKKGSRAASGRQDSDDEEKGYRTARPSSKENYADRRQVRCCSMQGETMFDFFKRRKRYALQQEIAKQQRPETQRERDEPVTTDRSGIAVTPDKSYKPHRLFDMSETKQSQLGHLNQSGLQSLRPNVSPIRRVTFGQSQQQTKKSRSILQALSPFKRRSNYGQTLDQSMNQDSEPGASTARRGSKPHDKLPVAKDNLIAKVMAVGEQVNRFTQQGKQYKNKSYSLVLDLMDALNAGLDEQRLSKYHSSRYRKMAELRLSKQNVDRLHKQFESAEPTDSLQEVAALLKSKLAMLQSQSHQHYERLLKRTVDQVSEQYERKLTAAEKQTRKLQQLTDSLERKLAKQLNRTAEQQHDQTQKQELNRRQLRERAEDWQRKLEQSEAKKEQYYQELEQATAAIKLLERQVKTLEHDKQSLVKSFEQERREVQHAKNAIVLEELNRSKLEYEKHLQDVQRVSDLKQARLLEKLHLLQTTADDKTKKLAIRSNDQQIICQQLKIQRTQVEQQRAQVHPNPIQNHSLRSAVRLLQDQSYLFWSALKDIKVLSTRLNIFSKFGRIYQDIRFSDMVPR